MTTKSGQFVHLLIAGPAFGDGVGAAARDRRVGARLLTTFSSPFGAFRACVAPIGFLATFHLQIKDTDITASFGDNVCMVVTKSIFLPKVAKLTRSSFLAGPAVGHGIGAAAGDRRVGARLLPPVQERPPRVPQADLGGWHPSQYLFVLEGLDGFHGGVHVGWCGVRCSGLTVPFPSLYPGTCIVHLFPGTKLNLVFEARRIMVLIFFQERGEQYVYGL